MAGKTIGKIVYDYAKAKTEISYGCCDQELTETKSEHGEWPTCLPKEWKGKVLSSNGSCFGEEHCSCGAHILYWLKVPGVWPEEERIRVVENN